LLTQHYIRQLLIFIKKADSLDSHIHYLYTGPVSTEKSLKTKKAKNKREKYKRMLAGMRSNESSKSEKDYTVYILSCAGGTMYTGIAKNVLTRLQQHQEGKGAKYTRTHLPVELIYQEDGYTRSEALIREAKIKSLPTKKKRELCLSLNLN